jgi:hypothetical protein
MNVLSHVLMVAVAAAAGVLGGVLYVKHQPPPQRIVIVDMRGLAEAVTNDSTLSDTGRQERVALLGASVNRMVGLYAEQGAIVLDANAVLRAPKEAYVQP